MRPSHQEAAESTIAMSIAQTASTLLGRAFAQRWVRFGLVGGAATLSYFLLGIFFVNLIKIPLLLGNGLAYCLSFFISYAGQSRWTFQAEGKDSIMMLRFALAQAAGLGLNSLIIEACSDLGLLYEISMAITIATVPIFVYLLCKLWVFRQRGVI